MKSKSRKTARNKQYDTGMFLKTLVSLSGEKRHTAM
jgi:hypothetical protein